MALQKIANIKGPTGDSAGIAAVTAEQVAWNAAPSVATSGPDTAKAFHFRIPAGAQGLPGANALPTAEAIAQHVLLPGQARDAVDSRIAVNNTSVPVRATGVIALFGRANGRG